MLQVQIIKSSFLSDCNGIHCNLNIWEAKIGESLWVYSKTQSKTSEFEVILVYIEFQNYIKTQQQKTLPQNIKMIIILHLSSVVHKVEVIDLTPN